MTRHRFTVGLWSFLLLAGSIFPAAAAAGQTAQAAAGQPLRVQARPTTLTGELAAEWSAYDDSALVGPFTLRFTVRRHDGKPAAGKPWTLAAGGAMPEDPSRRVVAEGVVPESGIVEVTGLGGIEQTVTTSALRAQRRLAPWYTVLSEDRTLGQVSFFEWGRFGPDNKVAEFLPPDGGRTVREREYKLPPDIGEPAPEITLTALGTSEPVRLSDLRGRIVLLEFWSARCHSCEVVLEKNQELMARRGREWEGKALLLTANMDADPSVAAELVRKKGWNGMRHTWSGEGGTGRYSAAAEAYVVTGTPVGVLIGPDGRILWRGSPHQLNLEETLDKLIAAQ